MTLITEDVSFSSEGRTLEGYLARPEGEGPFPGVVVIHEAFGLNANIRSIAERFAGEGYAALAVDLFSGGNRAVCMFQLMGGMLFNSLNHRGIQGLKAALTFLSARSNVESEHIGAVGYCMGGSFAIAWASTDNRLKAIAPYYAMNPRPLEAIQRLCPVVGSYPDKDFTTSHGQKLDVELERYAVPHDIKIYPGSRHSFFNEQRASAYNAEAAADSWKRVLAFFETHVKA